MSFYKVASALASLQALSRIFTFALNQALVRLASPEVFGVAALQFELLLSTILFLSREGVRNALRRSAASTSHKTQIVNITLIPILAGGPLAFFATLLYILYAPNDTRLQPYFGSSVVLYGIAACIELLTEPFFFDVQNAQRLEIRLGAEGAAIVAKNASTFLVLVGFKPEFALLGFALGQLMYAITLLAYYLLDKEHLPLHLMSLRATQKDGKDRVFDDEMLSLSAAMTKQSVVKHVLTEGDKLMVSRISPLKDQGGYALASNYGGLIARIIFQPMEEAARVFFAKNLSQLNSSTNGKKNADESTAIVKSSNQSLQQLLLLQTYLSSFIIAFGPSYLPTLLKYLLPARYLSTSAPRILHVYIAYIPAMALNGMLEAFVSTISSTSELANQSRWMVFFSVAYILSGALFATGLDMGDVGLVWANVVNSSVRAIYCWLFIERWFRRNGDKIKLQSIIPRWFVFVALGVSAWLTQMSAKNATKRGSFKHDRSHILIGFSCFTVCFAISIYAEMRKLRNLKPKKD